MNCKSITCHTIEDIVRSSYLPAHSEETDCLSLSAATIHQVLKKKFPTALRDCIPGTSAYGKYSSGDNIPEWKMYIE